MTVTAATETVFPAVGKGMPDVISYLDEVPWSTAVDVKPMKKSVMTESTIPAWPKINPWDASFRLNPTTPYIFFSKTGIEGTLDVGINATDLTVTSADLVTGGMRPIVFINGPVEMPSFLVGGQIPQELPESLGPFMMIDDEVIRYENTRDFYASYIGTTYYYPLTNDFNIPSVSERGMLGTTATSHLAGATIKELIVGYITGVEYSSNSKMVTIRTNIMKENWITDIFINPMTQMPTFYRRQESATPEPHAFSVPRKQISTMGLGQ